MNHDEFDDLDHAIAALPLATPPPGLRAAILRSTVYAQTAPSLVLGTLEVIAIGSFLAIAVWLTLTMFLQRGFAASVASFAGSFAAALGDPHVIAWLAVGAVVSLALAAPLGRPLRLRDRRA